MRLVIDRSEAIEALDAFLAFAPNRFAADCQLHFDGENLTIDRAGNSVSMAARGQWASVARVAGSFFEGLAYELPDSDPIEMRVDDGRLHIGTLSVDCAVQEVMQTEVWAPIDADLPTLLSLHFCFAPEQIEAAGLARAIEEARHEASEYIEEAAAILAPLGITSPELANFIRTFLQRRKF